MSFFFEPPCARSRRARPQRGERADARERARAALNSPPRVCAASSSPAIASATASSPSKSTTLI